jgi:hypothetical protein
MFEHGKMAVTTTEQHEVDGFTRHGEDAQYRRNTPPGPYDRVVQNDA